MTDTTPNDKSNDRESEYRNATISDLYPFDNLEGNEIKSVVPTSEDNAVMTFEVTLSNGLVFEGNIRPSHLTASDIDTENVLIDGLPVDPEE